MWIAMGRNKNTQSSMPTIFIIIICNFIVLFEVPCACFLEAIRHPVAKTIQYSSQGNGVIQPGAWSQSKRGLVAFFSKQKGSSMSWFAFKYNNQIMVLCICSMQCWLLKTLCLRLVLVLVYNSIPFHKDGIQNIVKKYFFEIKWSYKIYSIFKNST